MVVVMLALLWLQIALGYHGITTHKPRQQSDIRTIYRRPICPLHCPLHCSSSGDQPKQANKMISENRKASFEYEMDETIVAV